MKRPLQPWSTARTTRCMTTISHRNCLVARKLQDVRTCTASMIDIASCRLIENSAGNEHTEVQLLMRIETRSTRRFARRRHPNDTWRILWSVSNLSYLTLYVVPCISNFRQLASISDVPICSDSQGCQVRGVGERGRYC